MGIITFIVKYFLNITGYHYGELTILALPVTRPVESTS